jgi:hypothetical protein
LIVAVIFDPRTELNSIQYHFPAQIQVKSFMGDGDGSGDAHPFGNRGAALVRMTRLRPRFNLRPHWRISMSLQIRIHGT